MSELNLPSTGMIIFEMRRIAHAIRAITGSNSAGKGLRVCHLIWFVYMVLVIFVESAVLQTRMTICILVSFQCGLAWQATLTALEPVVFGTFVCLIRASRPGMDNRAQSANSYSDENHPQSQHIDGARGSGKGI
ncbi:hypothetical protein B0H19DRAFT_94394 [Mycena capillaripes]|nr:hypothetical protein B0H19DRAFT_94394 [Mycena capillaripes]